MTSVSRVDAVYLGIPVFTAQVGNLSRAGDDVSVVGLDGIWVTNTPGHIVQQLHVAECRLHSRRCVGSIVGLDD